MEKRIIAIFAIALFIYALLEGRLMTLSTNAKYISSAKKQSECVLKLGDARGNIYDKDGHKLTNTTVIPLALVSPGEKSYLNEFKNVPASQRAAFYEGTKKFKPFLSEVSASNNIDEDFLFTITERYPQFAVAPHIVGYIDSAGNGCYGAEYAYDDIIHNSAAQRYVSCTTSAIGTVIGGAVPKITIKNSSNDGIMLTLDTNIQRICEGVADELMDKGSILVMDTITGRVRASVSMPRLDPNNIAQSLEAENTPFINRSIAQYNVGSIFKPLLAAAALEKGYDKEKTYKCNGAIEVDGHIYRCAHGKGHGEINMREAMEQSCNCYFVNLGLELGAKAVYRAARDSGFGEATAYMGSMLTAAGVLPSEHTLNNTGQLASISFGQGELMASPVQMAAFINIFANNGQYIEPLFAEGIVNENSFTVTNSFYHPQQRIVYSDNTAKEISAMLQGVVTEGLGINAKPFNVNAAGKTGTAQTGRVDSDKNELMNAWFVGYFPIEKPKYTIAVLLDNGLHNSDDACKIFAKIVNTIFLLIDNH